MSEILTPVENQLQAEQPQQEQKVMLHKRTESREELLQQLLPVDYEYAQEQGLIDMFDYDPAKGRDGLLHTLVGDTQEVDDETFISEGFHHESSAEIAGPRMTTAEGLSPATFVDYSKVGMMNSKDRAKYKRYPLEPYAAQVVIGGARKTMLQEGKQVSAKNSMYPPEYDTLAVLFTIRAAYENQDTATEQPSFSREGRPVIVTQGDALLMDNKTPMPIRLILDPETRKIITAIPLLKQRPGMMKLTPDQADEIIYGNLKKEPK